MIIVPNSRSFLSRLELIDIRLKLYPDYTRYVAEQRIKGNSSIGTYEQWLCWNQYSSLVEFLEEYKSVFK